MLDLAVMGWARFGGTVSFLAGIGSAPLGWPAPMWNRLLGWVRLG